MGQSVGHILGKIQGYCGDRLKKRGVVSLIVCVLMEKKELKWHIQIVVVVVLMYSHMLTDLLLGIEHLT